MTKSPTDGSGIVTSKKRSDLKTNHKLLKRIDTEYRCSELFSPLYSLSLKFTCNIIVAGLLMLGGNAAWAKQFVVERIDLEGNNKTRPLTILRELSYTAGNSVDQETLDTTAQAVKNLGLFETVEVTTTENDDGTVVILIKVKEKRFNFILPKLNRNGDGDITTGLVWRSDNLFGRNQQSKLTYAYRTFDDADEEDETQIKWEFKYPRIANTPYSMSFTVLDEETHLEETVDDETGEYDRNRQFARLLLGGWLNQKGPSRGLNLKAGPLYETYDHTYISGAEEILPDLTIQAIIARLDGYYVTDNLLSRSGHHYGYELTVSDDATGSDINYLKHTFFYRKYTPIGKIDHQNLNLQFKSGLITEPILGPPEFQIGGSRNLRGYGRDEVEGNIFTILNIEYLRPILNRETLRAALFTDIGNAWEDTDDISFSDFKYGVGFGLRWKLKRFVRTDVRLDIAQGLTDEGETKAYLSTRATF
jgi:outer membrane protein insertion porin family